jgi:hypothetical protein
LAAIKLTTVQVTQLPLQHKILKIGIICFAKPILTEGLYTVKENFQKHVICAIRTLDESPSILIRDKPIFSSERM